MNLSVAMEKLVPVVFLSEFDKYEGTVIRNQYPLDESTFPLISDQVEDINFLLMPLNLQKYLNTESFTIVKLKINATTNTLSYYGNASDDQDCYLYTVSLFKTDESYRGGTAKSLSIIITSHLFHSLKPLLFFSLHQLFDIKDDSAINSMLESLHTELNQLDLFLLQNSFINLKQNENFLLSRLPNLNSNLINNLCLKYLSKTKIDNNDKRLSLINALSKDTFKFKIMISQMPFPMNIPISSLIYSKFGFYGLDLNKEKILFNLVDLLNKSTLKIHNPTNFNEIQWSKIDSICPYKYDTKIIQVVLLALLQNKKIIIFGNEVCINQIMDTVISLSIIINDDKDFFPYIDLSQWDAIQNLDSYIFGTTNLLYKEKKNSLNDKLMWDLFLDLDEQTLLVNEGDAQNTANTNSNNNNNNNNNNNRNSRMSSHNGSGTSENNIDGTYMVSTSPANASNSNNTSKRGSVVSNSQFKLRNIFKRKSVSSISSTTSTMTTATGGSKRLSSANNYYNNGTYNRDSINSIEDEFENKLNLDNSSIDRFSMSNPSNTKTSADSKPSASSSGAAEGIIDEYINPSKFKTPTNRDSFFGLGFQYDDKLLSMAEFEQSAEHIKYAKIDDAFIRQLDNLIANKHDDLTIYKLITNYLWSLIHSIYPVFENLDNLNKLNEYEYFTQNKMDDEDGVYLYSNSINSEIGRFIKKEKIVQPLPFGLTLDSKYNSNNGNENNDEALIVTNFASVIGYRILIDYYDKIFEDNSVLYKSFLKLTTNHKRQKLISVHHLTRSKTLFNVNEFVYHFDINHALHCITILAQEGHGLGGLKFQDDVQQIVINPYDVLVKLKYIGQIFKLLNKVISTNRGFVEFICHCIRYDELLEESFVKERKVRTKRSRNGSNEVSNAQDTLLLDSSLTTLENVLLTAIFFTNESHLLNREQGDPCIEEFTNFLNKFFKIKDNDGSDHESRSSDKTQTTWLIDWIDENLNDFVKFSISDFVKYHM